MTPEQVALFELYDTNGKLKEMFNTGSKAFSRIDPSSVPAAILSCINPSDSRGGECLHWEQPRTLTIMEAKRAQGFLDDEVLVGSARQAYKIFGNSVARGVALSFDLSLYNAWSKDVPDSRNISVLSSLVFSTSNVQSEIIHVERRSETSSREQRSSRERRFSKERRSSRERRFKDIISVEVERMFRDEESSDDGGANLVVNKSSLQYLEPVHSTSASSGSNDQSKKRTLVLKRCLDMSGDDCPNNPRAPSLQKRGKKPSAPLIISLLSEDEDDGLESLHPIRRKSVLTVKKSTAVNPKNRTTQSLVPVDEVDQEDDEEEHEYPDFRFGPKVCHKKQVSATKIPTGHEMKVSDPTTKGNFGYEPVDNSSLSAYAQTNKYMKFELNRRHGPKSTW